MIARLRARTLSGRGDTLLELIIAVAIMGIAITAILTGVVTAVSTSGQHRAQAQANAFLVSAADAVKEESSKNYVDCATPGDYNPISGVTSPTGWSAQISSVEYWNGVADFTSSCPAQDLKLQRITVAVTSPDGNTTGSVELVKRKPS